MFDRILKRLRELVRDRRYVVTIHADDEMDDEAITLHDLECAIFRGRIVERQKDRASGEWKYRVNGRTIADEPLEVIVKIGPTDKVVFITVYTP